MLKEDESSAEEEEGEELQPGNSSISIDSALGDSARESPDIAVAQLEDSF